MYFQREVRGAPNSGGGGAAARVRGFRGGVARDSAHRATAGRPGATRGATRLREKPTQVAGTLWTMLCLRVCSEHLGHHAKRQRLNRTKKLTVLSTLSVYTAESRDFSLVRHPYCGFPYIRRSEMHVLFFSKPICKKNVNRELC